MSVFKSTKHRFQQDWNGDHKWSPFSFFIFLFSTLSLISIPMSTEANNLNPIKAWFKFVPGDNSLLVLPMCRAGKDSNIYYEISALKIGPSGRSSNAQSGQLFLPSQQNVSLSRLQFGLTAGNHYQFTIRVLINSKLITTVTANYP